MRSEEKWWSKRTIEVLRKIIVEQPISLTELAKVYHGDTNSTLRAIRNLKRAGFPIKEKILKMKLPKKGKLLRKRWLRFYCLR